MKKMKSISSRVAQNQVSGPSQNFIFHPTSVLYFDQPKASNLPEVDYNTTSYYVDLEEFEAEFTVPEAIKSDLELQLTAVMTNTPYVHDAFPCAVMATTEGGPAPSHRPLITDHPHLHQGFWAFLVWCSNILADEISWKLFPSELIAIIDPKPDIDVQDLPIYNFPDFEAQICIASYSDAIHVMRVEQFFSSLVVGVMDKNFSKPSRAYAEIRVEGQKMFAGVPPTMIPRGMIVVVWNAKSMTRPSFRETFFSLFATYHPSLIVVTEARISNNDGKELINNLPGKYDSTVFDNIDLCGGVVLMWRVNELYVSYKEADFMIEDALFNVTFEVLFFPNASLFSKLSSYTCQIHVRMVPISC